MSVAERAIHPNILPRAERYLLGNLLNKPRLSVAQISGWLPSPHVLVPFRLSRSHVGEHVTTQHWAMQQQSTLP